MIDRKNTKNVFLGGAGVDDGEHARMSGILTGSEDRPMSVSAEVAAVDPSDTTATTDFYGKNVFTHWHFPYPRPPLPVLPHCQIRRGVPPFSRNQAPK